MLQLLELENVCQFRQFRVELSPGMTGIIGENGRGKSNLLKSILFALTGTFDNAGVKTENIRQGKAPDEVSCVRLTLTRNDHTYRIVRYLEGPKSILEVDGQRAAVGEVPVTQAIMTALGVREDILRRQVFVPQGDVAGFLNEAPTARAAAYARIFGTEKAAEVHAMIDRALKLEVLPPEDPEIPRLQAERVAIQREIQAKRRQLFLGERGLARQSPATVEAEIQQRQAHLEGLQVLEQSTTRRVSLLADLQFADAALARAEATHARLAEQLRQETEHARIARDWQLFDAATRDAEFLAQEEERLNSCLAALPADPSTFPPLEHSAAQAEASVRLLEQQQADLAEKIRRMTEIPPDTCPTCGKPGFDVAALLAESRQEHERLTQDYEQWCSFLVYAREQEAALRHARDAHENYRRERASWLTQQQKHVPAVQPTDPRPVGRPTTSGTATAVRNAAEDVQNCRSTQARLAVSVQQLEEKIQELSQLERVAIPQLVYEIEVRRQMLDTLRAQQNTLAALQGELSALTNQLEKLVTNLTAREENERALRPAREWRERLLAVRDVFHPTALPKIVAERNQAILVDQVNLILASYGVDWRVVQGPELSFIAQFDDGRQQPDRRLSPGQATALALAVRVAIYSLFAQDFGFLALDEPTYGLSQRSLEFVVKALGRLRLLTEAGSLQCLIVSHEPALTPVFDRVLDLDHDPRIDT